MKQNWLVAYFNNFFATKCFMREMNQQKRGLWLRDIY